MQNGLKTIKLCKITEKVFMLIVFTTCHSLLKIFGYSSLFT